MFPVGIRVRHVPGQKSALFGTLEEKGQVSDLETFARRCDQSREVITLDELEGYRGVRYFKRVW